MSKTLFDCKAELVRRGIHVKRVSDETGISYDRLLRVLNGYCRPDEDVLSRIQDYITDFDSKAR